MRASPFTIITIAILTLTACAQTPQELQLKTGSAPKQPPPTNTAPSDPPPMKPAPKLSDAEMELFLKRRRYSLRRSWMSERPLPYASPYRMAS
jgi:flagellar basal body L-ring protein FlgH